jgi:hypothetical protein
MEYRKENNGSQTFLEFRGLYFAPLMAIVLVMVMNYFSDLNDRNWIYFLVSGLVLLVSGAALVVYAKLRAYRTGQFFTFGVKSVPKSLVRRYLLGWLVFVLSVLLLLALLLAHR